VIRKPKGNSMEVTDRKKVRSSDPKQGIYLSEAGQAIYDDCVEVLSNVIETTAETNVYARKLVDLMMEGADEAEIYRWLKATTEKLSK
jgi:hypothetical protein